jgi:hypothetical protein
MKREEAGEREKKAGRETIYVQRVEITAVTQC